MIPYTFWKENKLESELLRWHRPPRARFQVAKFTSTSVPQSLAIGIEIRRLSESQCCKRGQMNYKNTTLTRENYTVIMKYLTYNLVSKVLTTVRCYNGGRGGRPNKLFLQQLEQCIYTVQAEAVFRVTYVHWVMLRVKFVLQQLLVSTMSTSSGNDYSL